MNEPTPSTTPTTRREFIKTTGRIAAASALAGVALPHVHAASSDVIQVGLVGSGGRGTGAAGNALGTAINRFCAQAVIAGDITPGRLSQFVLYAVFAASGLGQLSEVWGELSQASGAAERLFEIMNVRPVIEAPPSWLNCAPRFQSMVNGRSVARKSSMRAIPPLNTMTGRRSHGSCGGVASGEAPART